MRSLLVLSLAVLSASAASLGAVAIVQQIVPNAKSCPQGNTDCRTAAQAAPYIAKAMADHGIYSVNQMAAVIALMAFESVDFQYKHNVSPGRPGQGTANMQMAVYNLKYAKSLPGIADKVKSYSSSILPDVKLNEILALVTPDQYNFGSGPWFLATQCDQGVRDQLDKNPDEGFTAYMGCVGTPVTEERLAYFTRAKAAFGIK